MEYTKRAEELENWIISNYEYLHTNPELGFREWKTADYIENELNRMDGIQVLRPCETGVMGILRGTRPGKTVAFRADMDGLPLEELADVPYASCKKGVMHACGHDGHVAMLLGAARLLSERKQELAGEIRFLFQPAEEVLPGGAVSMIKGGALEGVDQIFGAHLDVLHPINSFGLHIGPLMASSISFEIVVEGEGGHAAFPFQTVDTVYTAAQIITSIQGIVTRNISAVHRAVITVTELKGSAAPNVIPAQVKLGGTIRVLDTDCEEILKQRLEEVVKGCCETWGAKGNVAFSTGLPALVNPPEIFEIVEKAVRKCSGTQLYEDTPVLGGEDFAEYLQRIPGFYYKVGARPEKGEVYPHHNPRFRLNEKALAKGAAVCAQLLSDAVRL